MVYSLLIQDSSPYWADVKMDIDRYVKGTENDHPFPIRKMGSTMLRLRREASEWYWSVLRGKALSRWTELCHKLLKGLQTTLDKHQELGSSASPTGKRLRRVWKRLTWDESEIEDFRSRVDTNINLFNLFLGKLNRYAVICLSRHNDKG